MVIIDAQFDPVDVEEQREALVRKAACATRVRRNCHRLLLCR